MCIFLVVQLTARLVVSMEQAIWHLLYSTTSKAEIDKSLSPSDNTNGIFKKLIDAGISVESIEKIKTIPFW